MKKQKILTLLICISTCSVQAQQGNVSMGGELTGTGGMASYSLGQIDYTTKSGSGGTASDGMQHAYEIYVLGVNKHPDIQLNMDIYPNPVNSNLTLSIGSSTFQHLVYRLSDANGRLIFNKEITNEKTQIPVQSLAAGIYFLEVKFENSLLKAFKVIKN